MTLTRTLSPRFGLCAGGCVPKGRALPTELGPSTGLSDCTGYTARESCIMSAYGAAHTTITSHLVCSLGGLTPSGSACDPIPCVLPININNALVCSDRSTLLTDLEMCITTYKTGNIPSVATLVLDTSSATVYVPLIFAGQSAGVGMVSVRGAFS